MSRAFTAGTSRPRARARRSMVAGSRRVERVDDGSMGGGDGPGETKRGGGRVCSRGGTSRRSGTLQNSPERRIGRTTRIHRPRGRREPRDHEDEEDEEVEEEEDDAAAPRTVPPRGAHIRSYHVVYSKSYGCPVLLVRGVSCEARRSRHGSRGDGGVARGGGDERSGGRRRGGAAAARGVAPQRRRRTVWAIRAIRAMRAHRVCAVGASARGGAVVGSACTRARRGARWRRSSPGKGTVGSGPAMYMSAWISFVAAAVADLPVPAHRINS